MPKFVAPTEWVAPSEFPELKDAKEIEIEYKQNEEDYIYKAENCIRKSS